MILNKIPIHISEEEVLVRFIMPTHLKNKNKPLLNKTQIIDGEIFTNTKGVSLQRENYCDRIESIQRAQQVSNPNKYLGLVIFSKKDFDEAVKEVVVQNPNFDAAVLATPLDENNQYIIVMGDIYSGIGNFSHADLIVFRPDPAPDEQPNTVRRKFSRKIFQRSNFYFPD